MTELVRLLPEIRPHWPDLPDPPTLLPEEECRRLFEALTQTILALNEQPCDLAGARAAYQQALTDFEATTQQAEAGRAYLLLAESYLPSGEGAEVMRWAEAALPHIEAEANPRAAAHAHFLLGAGGLRTGRSLAEAEAHLRTAARLAETHALADLRARVHLELGNLLAQRGNVAAALQIFEETIGLAAQAGDHFWAVLGHNNLAYHALLVDDLVTARQQLSAAQESLAGVTEPYLQTKLDLWRAELYIQQGDRAGAEAILGEVETRLRQREWGGLRAWLERLRGVGGPNTRRRK